MNEKEKKNKENIQHETSIKRTSTSTAYMLGRSEQKYERKRKKRREKNRGQQTAQNASRYISKKVDNQKGENKEGTKEKETIMYEVKRREELQRPSSGVSSTQEGRKP